MYKTRSERLIEEGWYSNCEIAAAAAAAVAVAAVAASAAGAVTSAKAAKKGQKVTTTNTPPPQQTAIQQIVSRLILGRYAQGPQTFGSYRQEGPRPYPQTNYSPFEAQALGMLPDQVTGAMHLPSHQTIYPQVLTPEYINLVNQSFTPEAMLQNVQNPRQAPPWTINERGIPLWMNPPRQGGQPGALSDPQQQMVLDFLQGRTPQTGPVTATPPPTLRQNLKGGK